MVDSETKIIEGVEEALKNLLIEKADTEISRLTAEFERSLQRKKEEAVAKVFSGIKITAERNAADAVFDIRIRFRGGDT
jgi:hypothetical protein